MYYSLLPHTDAFSKGWFWCIELTKFHSNGINMILKKWTSKHPLLTFRSSLAFVKEHAAGVLSCQIYSRNTNILNISEYPKTPRTLFSLLLLLVPPLCLFPLSFRPVLPFSPAEPSQTALNEQCLHWAQRQSINCALSLVAGCLSQTLQDGAGGEGGAIREHLRAYLSRTTQREGAQMRR